MLTRLAIQLKSRGILNKPSSPKDYCICAEPSREKEKSRAVEGAQTGTIAKFICPQGHAALCSERSSDMQPGIVPRVSIGLPVFNGGSMLIEAIDSILSQTFRDFELVIFDNASTDSTEDLCRAYVTRDQRIRYFRGEVNRGAQYSHNEVVKLSRGEYFHFAGHDDILAPHFLERCVEILDTRPELVLCFCNFSVIDESGSLVGPGTPTPRLLEGRPAHRIRAFWRASRVSQVMYGLIRRSALEKTELRDWYGSDRALLLDLVLIGGFERIDETLFFHREHQGRSAYQGENINRIWSPQLQTRSAGYWQRLNHLLRMIQRDHLSRTERLAVVRECLRYASRRLGHWGTHLWRDFTVAVKEAALSDQKKAE